MIVVNRSKAEGIFWDRIRVEREPRLQALDIEYMRATEQGADASTIVSQKQQLRDVTARDISSLPLDQLSRMTLDELILLPIT